jgi:hypothetical protein
MLHCSFFVFCTDRQYKEPQLLSINGECGHVIRKSYDMTDSKSIRKDWTEAQLFEYDIIIQNIVSLPNLFGKYKLPQPTVSSTILNNLNVPAGPLPKADRQFFHYLRDVMRAGSDESCVGDYAAHILRLVDYDEPDFRVIRQRKELSFTMCGQRVHVTPSVCITNDTDGIFLVLEGEVLTNPSSFFGWLILFTQHNAS